MSNSVALHRHYLFVGQISQARAHAIRRGQKHFKAEDLVFILRHDRDKVNRLRTYLSWKDVRKTAKESGEGGGDEVDIGDDVDKPGVQLSLFWI